MKVAVFDMETLDRLIAIKYRLYSGSDAMREEAKYLDAALDAGVVMSYDELSDSVTEGEVGPDSSAAEDFNIRMQDGSVDWDVESPKWAKWAARTE